MHKNGPREILESAEVQYCQNYICRGVVEESYMRKSMAKGMVFESSIWQMQQNMCNSEEADNVTNWTVLYYCVKIFYMQKKKSTLRPPVSEESKNEMTTTTYKPKQSKKGGKNSRMKRNQVVLQSLLMISVHGYHLRRACCCHTANGISSSSPPSAVLGLRWDEGSDVTLALGAFFLSAFKWF